MIYLSNFFRHLNLVNHHRFLVMKHCFKVGLYYQGLVHDLSKYSPTEFFRGVKYFQGTRSPISYEREVKGLSLAVLHHYARNKHHIEYWMDYAPNSVVFGGVRIPVKYVVESVCDRMAASKTYLKEKYTQVHPLKYYLDCETDKVVHPETNLLFLHFLHFLAEKGEDACFLEMRKFLKLKDAYQAILPKQLEISEESTNQQIY